MSNSASIAEDDVGLYIKPTLLSRALEWLRLYRLKPAKGPSVLGGHDEAVFIHPWLYRRRKGSNGGHTRLFGGAFVASWGQHPCADYAPTRHWALFDLVCLHHVDDKDGTLISKRPGWSMTFCKVEFKFKRADKYVW